TPTTDFLTRLAEYSKTGMPRSAGASSTTPRATPSFNVEAGFLLTKVSSTAASSGAKRSSTPLSWRNRSTSRVASFSPSREWTTPAATWLSRLPATSTTPQPVWRSPGSSPSRRMAMSLTEMPARSGAQSRHDVVGHLEIGKHVLHVVAVLQSLQQLEQRLRGLPLYGGLRLGLPQQSCRLGRAEAALQRVAHRVECVGRAGHDMLGAALDIVGAGLDGGLEHGIRRRRLGGIDDLADAVEHEAHAVALAERAAGLGEGGAHVARGAVAIVGERLDDDGDAAGTIALVAHLLVLLAVLAACAAPDRALDGVLRHVRFFGGDDGGAQPRIGGDVGQAGAGSRGQLADDLGEDLGALLILRALAVHDVLELGMAR